MPELFSDAPLLAEVILPLALRANYTYGVPKELESQIAVGKRVEIQFGSKKIYAGVVKALIHQAPEGVKIKPILNVLDDKPIVNNFQFELWTWMADYYMCYEGEVMNAALPAGFKLESESRIMLNPNFNEAATHLDDNEYLVMEALQSHPELSVTEVQKLLGKSSVRHILNMLLRKKVIVMKEELQERYHPRKETFIRLNPEYEADEKLHKVFDELERAPKQLALLMAYIHLIRAEKMEAEKIKRSILLKKADSTAAALDGLVKKNIFIQSQEVIDRLAGESFDENAPFTLSDKQQEAIELVKERFKEHHTVLLHGVTASGKTNIYIRLIEEELAKGKQVLYLVPEIALTTQLVFRLQKYFGNRIGVYHSKFNQQERVEIWNKLIKREYDIVLGARSALFLPFESLGLIIVDEEHDSSFKQQDPAPRYHARDSAIYLASLFNAKTLLGTATPSLESYYNAMNNKYGLVKLQERFSGVEMPQIVLVDTKEEKKRKLMQSHFTSVLMKEMKETLDKKEQVILFQNRRGYAPFIECAVCSWIPQCPNCDVNLTYHKFHNELKCHYCGYRRNNFTTCPACKSPELLVQGFGTEKLEDELHIFFPDLKVGRMDLDSIRTKAGHNRIIHEFEEERLQVMVGTQMVTKGLDFDKVSLVGIMSADQLLNYGDFRATERAYQLMEQVSGRAGRKHKRGKVVIQTNSLSYPTLQFVQQYDYESFYKWEISHRGKFSYPPFTRLIKITVKHKDKKAVEGAAQFLAKELQLLVGKRLLGPAEPYVGRIQLYYLQELLIKLEKAGNFIHEVKIHLRSSIDKMLTQPGFASIKTEIDVDPY